MTTAMLAALATPAAARLQLSIGVGGSTFTCFDGQLSCDQSGGANNLLTIDQNIGGAFVQLTLAQSTFGPNSLQLSSSNIVNESGVPVTVTLLASDTGFLAPVSFINNSGSLTFNQNVGATDSTLKFWACTPPILREPTRPILPARCWKERFGSCALTDPDSFFWQAWLSPFPRRAVLFHDRGRIDRPLIPLGSVTGFNQSMESGARCPNSSTPGRC